MERNSRGEYSSRLLLDTSYVLPHLGVEVRGLEDLDEVLKGRRLYYPMAMMAELEGVVLKEVRRMRLESVPRQASEGLDYLVYGGAIGLVPPRGEDLESMRRVLNAGWRDLFDAILYATASRMGVEALTLDSTFSSFIREKGFKHGLLITHNELERSSDS